MYIVCSFLEKWPQQVVEISPEQFGWWPFRRANVAPPAPSDVASAGQFLFKSLKLGRSVEAIAPLTARSATNVVPKNVVLGHVVCSFLTRPTAVAATVLAHKPLPGPLGGVRVGRIS